MKNLITILLVLVGTSIFAQRDTTYSIIEQDPKTGQLFKTEVNEYVDGRVTTSKIPMKDSVEIYGVYKQSFSNEIRRIADDYSVVIKERLKAKFIIQQVNQLYRESNIIALDTTGQAALVPMVFNIKGAQNQTIRFKITAQGLLQYKDSRISPVTWERAYLCGNYLMLRNFDGKQDVEFIFFADDKSKLTALSVGRDDILIQR